ncbi:Integrator complex subunit 11 [Cladochytrium tenue]|nr:Integrator complex subunit 11 [Cladochytrium tenue]
MAYNDDRRWPDFAYLSKQGAFNEALDCIIISHFHLDHCGALPYFTEVCGFDGPIYMTYPTRAICPILLEDMRKVVVERRGEANFFTSEDVRACMRKVIPVSLHEVVQVDDDLQISAYYAGHVLGAAMFRIAVGDQSVVYTGDYNMTPDRHLGSAWIDACRPDLLITETTYAVTIRASKRAREQDFLKQVHECVSAGGKVLIPVFALGRAQELCILVDQYWDRMALRVPVYFSAGLTERANQYYRLFVGWTNEKIKGAYARERNMFDFKYIRAFERHYADEPGPMVLFASPGMLHAGTSLDVFKKWCHDPKNMIILPGYCVPGTVGARVLAGEKVIETDRGQRHQVNLQVRNLSFSAHADAKGIMQLIRMARPRNVMLVHGEARKMAVLRRRVESELGVPCFDPANGCTVTIVTEDYMPAAISSAAYRRALLADADVVVEDDAGDNAAGDPGSEAIALPRRFVALLRADEGADTPRLYDAEEAQTALGLEPVAVQLQARRSFTRVTGGGGASGAQDVPRVVGESLSRWAHEAGVPFAVVRPATFVAGPVTVEVPPKDSAVIVKWPPGSETLAVRVFAVVTATVQ